MATSDRCVADLFEGRDVSSAVEEMSAAIDREIGASKKTVFSVDQTPAKDDATKVPTSILKRPTDIVGFIVTPSVDDRDLSRAKGSSRLSGSRDDRRSHNASNRSGRANDGSSRSSFNGTDKTLSRSGNDGVSINLGQYDYSDEESVDFEFGFTGEDRREEKADVTFDDEPTAATGNNTFDGAAGRSAPRQLVQGMPPSKSRTSGHAPGGGSSDDDSSNSSSGADSSDDSFSSKMRRRRRRKRRSKKPLDPSWDTLGARGQCTHRKSKREIEIGSQSSNGFSFVDDEKTLHSQLQCDGFVSEACQVQAFPYSSTIADLTDIQDFNGRRSSSCRHNECPPGHSVILRRTSITTGRDACCWRLKDDGKETDLGLDSESDFRLARQ